MFFQALAAIAFGIWLGNILTTCSNTILLYISLKRRLAREEKMLQRFEHYGASADSFDDSTDGNHSVN